MALRKVCYGLYMNCAGLGLNAFPPDDGTALGDAEPLEVGPSWREWAV